MVEGIIWRLLLSVQLVSGDTGSETVESSWIPTRREDISVPFESNERGAISTVRAGPQQLPVVLKLVQRLLMELSDDPAQFDGWDPVEVRPALEAAGDRFAALLAQTSAGDVVGVATLTRPSQPTPMDATGSSRSCTSFPATGRTVSGDFSSMR